MDGGPCCGAVRQVAPNPPLGPMASKRSQQIQLSPIKEMELAVARRQWAIAYVVIVFIAIPALGVAFLR